MGTKVQSKTTTAVRKRDNNTIYKSAAYTVVEACTKKNRGQNSGKIIVYEDRNAI